MNPVRTQSDRLNGDENLGRRLVQLSARRQKIIRPVLANPRRFVLMSVRKLAEELETDAATMVRIVRGLGFESYRAFQHHLHEASIAYATSLDTMQSSHARKDGTTAIVRESIDHDQKNLGRLHHSANPDDIAELARRIHSAGRILIFGGDVATSLVNYLEYNLTLLGLPAIAGTGHGRIWHLARSAGKNDLVLAISFRRGLRMTVEGLQQARANGAHCVGIADSMLSPVVRFSNMSFIALVETPSFGVSYVAPMALLNALLAVCANVNRSRTLAVLREVDNEQRHGSRWYPEDEP